MKKLFNLLVVGFLVLSCGSAFAAGTVTQAQEFIGSNVVCITYSWTADAAAATVPATESTWDLDGYVFLILTNPGATAPTDDYDITLTDDQGVDIAGGELANRDLSNSEVAVPKLDSVYGSRFVDGKVTLNLSNNSVNSAVGTVKIYLYK